MAVPTLLDIIKRNLSDKEVGLINETVKAHPEVTMGAARTINGLNYYTRVRTALPAGGFFRAANAGTLPGASTIENHLVETYILNPNWQCDKAAADASEDGAAAYLLEEAEAIMEAAWQKVSSQFYYGTSTDASGFPGLLAAYDSTNMVVDAAGTTATTGSSVWGVRWGIKECNWVVGRGGAVEMSDVIIQKMVDPNDATKWLTMYLQELLARIGLQVGNKWSCGRIKKVTADSSHTLTDAFVDQLIQLWPAGLQPDAIFMTMRSLRQLKNSRTATTPTGVPAAWPTETMGPMGPIPIIVTGGLVDTEPLTL